jgi:small-conductance mechanosensitive channel
MIAVIILLAFVWVMNLMAGDISAVWSIQWALVGLVALLVLDRQLPPLFVSVTLEMLTGGTAAPITDTVGTAPPRTERRDLVLAARRAFRAMAIAGLTVGVPTIAGYDVMLFLATDLGKRFWTIGTSLVVSYVAWQVVRAATDRYVVRRTFVGPIDEDETDGGVSRAGTLVPLLRMVAATVLVLIVAITTLSNSGIDVTPLLASAGIVGLAIGFGAQTLVRDIVSGVFFLIDDAFRVGEYVEFGELRGTVESITLRSVKLRHHLGQLQTVPFGELRSVSNHSRDWVIYKMEFRLPFDTDIEKVRKLIKSVGLDLLEHPDIGKDFIEPLKSQGVTRVEDTALVLRTKFTSKPHKQFGIRREALKRIQIAFAQNGISLAPTRVVVHSEGGPSGAAVAAAGTSIPEVKPGSFTD